MLRTVFTKLAPFTSARLLAPTSRAVRISTFHCSTQLFTPATAAIVPPCCHVQITSSTWEAISAAEPVQQDPVDDTETTGWGQVGGTAWGSRRGGQGLWGLT